MKLNSKILLAGCFVAVGLVWQGCQYQPPSAAPLAAPPVDQLSLLNITAGNLGPVTQPTPSISNVVNTNLYVHGGEPAITAANCLIKTSSYGMTPVTVITGPLPFDLITPTPVFNPEMHPYVASHYGTSVWQGFFNYSIIQTGLTSSTNQYGIQVTGFINDPENALYPPGPGNPDPISFEIFPYVSLSGATAGFNGIPAAYDISPFQGIEFYVNISSVDSAVDRVFLVSGLQDSPRSPNPPVGVCGDPDRPDDGHCFDAFQYDYTNSPRDQWVLVQKNWSDFKQYGFGSPMTPPTLTGTNLQQVVGFEWAETNGSQAGPITINYSLAGIRFF
ncbi:MAG TPA: hypothetical protein VK791_10035 [bacterium]|jgi:hypothetical protein|nr:hypothetical protein [bacterium]